MRFELANVDRFLRSISRSDRVAIIHDSDPDGICSGVILARCVKHLSHTMPVFVSPFDKESYSITKEMIKDMKAKGVNKIITTDFSLDQHVGLVNALKRDFELLLIDHHKLYNDVNGRRVVLVKPQFFCDIDPARYSCSKLAFDLCSRVCDMFDCDWLAAVGSIADVATVPWTVWLRGVFRRYGFRWKKDLFQTELGNIASIINSMIIINSALIGKAFRAVYRSRSPSDILESGLVKYKVMVDSELEGWIKDFRHSEKHGDLYFFMVSPRYNIKSTISTVLGLKYPHKTILVMDQEDGFVHVSARRGDQKLAVNTLLEKAIKGFSYANAGGHIPAAGARFESKDLDVFKKRVIVLAKH